MLKFLLKSKNVLYEVSSDLGEMKCFYSSFSDAGQEAPVTAFQKFKNAWRARTLTYEIYMRLASNQYAK